MSDFAGGNVVGQTLFTTVPVDLFRMENASGPRLVNVRLKSDQGEGLRLDATALRALIAAVDFQLADWRAKGPGDLDEDDLADMQNDIQYAEILAGSLRDELRRVSGR